MKGIWGLVAVVAILLVFAIVGLLHLIRPNRFMNRNTGGELLREWNRLGAQFAGPLMFFTLTFVTARRFARPAP